MSLVWHLVYCGIISFQKAITTPRVKDAEQLGQSCFFFMGRPRALIINLRSPQRPLMDKRNFNRLIKSKSVKIIPTTQRCTELFISY